MSKVNKIGIIAEDDSDFKSIKVMIQRVVAAQRISFRKKLGYGCGKVKKNLSVWANDLSRQGCDMVICCHDLDNRDLLTLRMELENKFTTCVIKLKFVCIPVEELEAWFLSDPEGLKISLSLKKVPSIKGNPESIKDPKERLYLIVDQCSNKEKEYIHTKHNPLIAQTISIDKVREKCASFREFYSFLVQHKYA